jgi:hypothetical protein
MHLAQRGSFNTNGAIEREVGASDYGAWLPGSYANPPIEVCAFTMGDLILQFGLEEVW